MCKSKIFLCLKFFIINLNESTIFTKNCSSWKVSRLPVRNYLHHWSHILNETSVAEKFTYKFNYLYSYVTWIKMDKIYRYRIIWKWNSKIWIKFLISTCFLQFWFRFIYYLWKEGGRVSKTKHQFFLKYWTAYVERK